MHEFHYIFLTTETDVAARVMVNGIPVLNGPRTAGLQWMDMLNVYLTGQESLQIDLKADGPLKATLRLRKYAQGMIVSDAEGIDYPADLKMLKNGIPVPMERDPSGDFTITSEDGQARIEGEVRTSGFNFSWIYRNPPLAPGMAQETASRILRDFESGSSALFLEHSVPLQHDYAVAYGMNEGEFRSQFEGHLSHFLGMEAVDNGPNPEFAELPILNGALVEVMVNGHPLIATKAENGGMNTIGARFASVDGRVLIVR